jgi:hypothetical protein
MTTKQRRLIPNSFQTPNAFVDDIMHLLESDEYKILSFATRHILGWRGSVEDRQSRISLTMFVDITVLGYPGHAPTKRLRHLCSIGY